MTLPVSLINDLELVPRDRPVGLLMRHSARFPITDEALNHLVGLTEEGVHMAEDLGAHLKPQFSFGRLMTSPVGRCVDTANSIARGADWSAQALIHEKLAHTFIEDAWKKVNKGEVNGHCPETICSLLDLLLGEPGAPRLDVMVSHDTVVGTALAHLLRVPVTGPDMPKYLEGFLVWRSEEGVHLRWRGTEYLLNGVYPENQPESH